MYRDLKVFSGNSNKRLAKEICRHLNIPLSKLHISRFSNDNLFLQVKENVREKDVFVIQSFSRPVSNHIMELLITLDALRSASAKRITAVVPYSSYARSDKKEIFRAECNPGFEALHCFAHLDQNVGEAIPYLNAVLGGFTYQKDPPRLAENSRDEEEALGHFRRIRDEIKIFVEKLPEILSQKKKDAVSDQTRFVAGLKSVLDQLSERLKRTTNS
ncbi:MAG: ribose-phosphate pyrophosphokinase-like domain-containing protein [Desulfobacterales bacterium]